MKTILAVAFFIAASQAHANQDDKNAGICAGYLALLQKDRAVNIALASADNHVRATNIAKQWIRDTQRNNSGLAAAVEGDAACKKIGIRPLDY